MADIFGGATPPAWLTDLTRQTPGELGSIAGLALGGAVNAATEGVSPKQGLGEARLNIEDPLWKLKVAQTQASILGTMAQTQSAYALAEERKQETAAWMQDAPQLSSWLTATPEQRQKMPAPVAVSKQGMTAIERSRDQDARYFIQKDANDIKQQNAENQSSAAKAAATNTKSFYDMLKTVTDPVAQATIMGMTKNGLPTPEAWEALTRAPRQTAEQEKQAGRQKLEEQKQTGREKIEEQKQTGRESLADINAQNKAQFEGERQQNRIELKKLEGENKIELEKMKLGAKDGNGNLLSEDNYVQRHFNTVFNAAWKESETKDIKQVISNVEKALRLRYRVEHKAAPAAPKPATPAPAAAAGAPATAAAAATTATVTTPPAQQSAGTNALSFDDFQNWIKGK